MIFKVKNLGYIKEAEVDLSKDLIVFTGQNNTGKTYLAYAIYALLSHKIFDDFIDIYLNIYPQKERTYSIQANSISFNLQEYFAFFSKTIHQSIQKNAENTLKRIFASDGEYFENIELQLKFDLEKVYKTTFYKVGIDVPMKEEVIPTQLKKKPNSFELILEHINIQNEDEEIINSTIPLALYFFFKEFLFKRLFTFTAERNAVNIFSKELSLAKSRVLKNKNGLSKNIQFLNRYPLPIQDSLEIAEDLAHLSRNKSEFVYLAEELEQDFLKGKISTNQYGQIEYTPDNEDNINLEVHLTASMVKSLSNIVFYLRHLAEKGDCIIIDEPELNLHPDNQRKIARFLGRLVNEGFQVIISTHSDYIIKELNNMIMLSKAKGERKDLIEQLGFRGDELIKPEQVEAQLFTLKSRIPEKIEITDEGFEVSTINEVIEKQDNDMETIYYELFQKVV